MKIKIYEDFFSGTHVLLFLHVHFHTVHIIQLPSVKFPVPNRIRQEVNWQQGITDFPASIRNSIDFLAPHWSIAPASRDTCTFRNKAISDNLVFLAVHSILELIFTIKFTNDNNGVAIRTRFSVWFPRIVVRVKPGWNKRFFATMFCF